MPTPGGARLQVIVRHPSFSPVPLPHVAGFSTFRSVTNAGSFEGQTTYGLGVRARLPFRVFTIAGGHGRIVVDVAHPARVRTPDLTVPTGGARKSADTTMVDSSQRSHEAAQGQVHRKHGG